MLIFSHYWVEPRWAGPAFFYICFEHNVTMNFSSKPHSSTSFVVIVKAGVTLTGVFCVWSASSFKVGGQNVRFATTYKWALLWNPVNQTENYNIKGDRVGVANTFGKVRKDFIFLLHHPTTGDNRFVWRFWWKSHNKKKYIKAREAINNGVNSAPVSFPWEATIITSLLKLACGLVSPKD